VSCRRLIVISSIALTALVGGACGTSQPSGRSSTPTTTPTTTPKRLKLASTGTIAAPAADAGTAIYPVRPTRYVLDTKLADLGTRATVLRMDPHSASEADVRRFAAALGVAGAPVHNPAGWELQTAQATLSVATTDGATMVSYARGTPSSVDGATGSGSSGSGVATPGSVVANGPTDAAPPKPVPDPGPGPTVPSPPPPPPPPVDVPSAADAQTIARALLDRMGVLSGQQWSIAVNDSGGVAVACAAGLPCPTVPPEVSARTVIFSLVLDSGPVDGVEWSVTVGEHRRVESVYGEWASPVAVGSYPLRSTAAVFADLQNGTARYPGVQAMATDGATAVTDTPPIAPMPIAPPSDTPRETTPAVAVHITGVSLGVARWSEIDAHGTVIDLVPVYKFHARADGGSTYDIVVLALEPSAVTFVNPAPIPQPLPAQSKG
jgi:hypothetical protein